jgi:long-chain acyl-CoA synthetase
MSKKWFQSYPKDSAHEINPEEYTSIVDLFEKSIDKYRQKIAYRCMGAALSYDELDKQSAQFASYLQNHCGLKKGDRVAIQMPNLIQYPIALFGALRAGMVVVNTNPLYTAREMKFQFKDSGVKAIVLLANFAHMLDEVVHETDIKHVVVAEIGDMMGFPKRYIVNAVVKYIKKMVPPYKLPGHISFHQSLALGSSKIHSTPSLTVHDIAFLQYTGGTTGVSKGAVLTHRNMLANMLQIREWMKGQLKDGEETIVTALPLYHIFSLTVNALAFMRNGATNLLITNPKDIPAFIKTLKTEHYTVLTGVNTLYNALMNHKDFNQINFSKVKISVAGGMALQKAVAERWMKLTKTKLVEGYGLTEASPVVCCNPIDGRDRVGTIGMPLPSTDIRLLDDDGIEVAEGQPGELCVKGPQVMQGYWNRPDETAKILNRDGWLKTGDVAVMEPDGYFKIVDRKKDMIIVSGFNVYPNEIEDVVASHPAIAEVAAVGIPDDKSGEVVKIFVVKKAHVTEQEIIEHCKTGLTGYKIPKAVEFRKELPKTNVGKILRRALRDEKQA